MIDPTAPISLVDYIVSRADSGPDRRFSGRDVNTLMEELARSRDVDTTRLAADGRIVVEDKAEVCVCGLEGVASSGLTERATRQQAIEALKAATAVGRPNVVDMAWRCLTFLIVSGWATWPRISARSCRGEMRGTTDFAPSAGVARARRMAHGPCRRCSAATGDLAFSSTRPATSATMWWPKPRTRKSTSRRPLKNRRPALTVGCSNSRSTIT